MSQKPEETPQNSIEPSRRDKLKPLELLLFSAVLAVFAGGVVLFATRSIMLGLIFFVIAFIVTVMMVALVGLGGKPSTDDLEARKDLKKPDSDFH